MAATGRAGAWQRQGAPRRPLLPCCGLRMPTQARNHAHAHTPPFVGPVLYRRDVIHRNLLTTYTRARARVWCGSAAFSRSMPAAAAPGGARVCRAWRWWAARVHPRMVQDPHVGSHGACALGVWHPRCLCRQAGSGALEVSYLFKRASLPPATDAVTSSSPSSSRLHMRHCSGGGGGALSGSRGNRRRTQCTMATAAHTAAAARERCAVAAAWLPRRWMRCACRQQHSMQGDKPRRQCSRQLWQAAPANTAPAAGTATHLRAATDTTPAATNAASSSRVAVFMCQPAQQQQGAAKRDLEEAGAPLRPCIPRGGGGQLLTLAPPRPAGDPGRGTGARAAQLRGRGGRPAATQSSGLGLSTCCCNYCLQLTHENLASQRGCGQHFARWLEAWLAA